jgi:hypothetical protein
MENKLTDSKPQVEQDLDWSKRFPTRTKETNMDDEDLQREVQQLLDSLSAQFNDEQLRELAASLTNRPLQQRTEEEIELIRQRLDELKHSLKQLERRERNGDTQQ